MLKLTSQRQSFGKRHIAEVPVLKITDNGGCKRENADLFELNPKDKHDKEYFNDLKTSWQGENRFLGAISSFFNFYNKRNPKKFYTLETPQQEAICIAQVGKTDVFCSKLDGIKSKNLATLDYIETNPQDRHESTSRRYKHAGAAMLAGLIEELRSDGKQGLWLVPDAKEFFADSACFTKSDIDNAIIIKEDRFQDFIDYVDRKNADSSLTFGKQVISTPEIRTTSGKNESGRFVIYNQKDRTDVNHVKNLAAKWATGFSDSYADEFQKNRDPESVFCALENKNGETLSIAKISDVYNPEFRPRNYIEIEYLETAPSERHGSKTRHYKGCGDILSREIVKKAGSDGKQGVGLCSLNDQFWESSGLFKQISGRKLKDADYLDFFLDKEDFQAYVDRKTNIAPGE